MVVFVLATFIFYFLPYLYLWENSFISIWDNLDSDVVWFKTLGDSGKILNFSNDTEIKQIMNGIPRNSLPPAFNFVTFLFYLFEPFSAYLINKILMHIVGFLGMYLLLKDFVFTKQDEVAYLFGLSLIFGLLPYYGTHPGLAISGLPLVAWCFIHLFKEGKGIKYYPILFSFCLYSSLIYSGLFILIILSIVWLIILINTSKIKYKFLTGILLMTMTYVLGELNLFSQFLLSDFQSHRSERVLKFFMDNTFFENFTSILYKNPSHAPSLHFPIIITSVIFSLLLSGLLFIFNLKERINYKILLYLLKITFFIIFVIIIYSLLSSSTMSKVIDEVYAMKVISWERVYWLLPFLWMFVFSLSIKILYYSIKLPFNFFFPFLLVLAQLLIVTYKNDELKYNYHKFLNEDYQLQNKKNPSFKEFYAEKLFSEIKTFIGKDPAEYRVISVGLYPDIAIYNGFYTLDSYQRNYPLSYKYKFRNIIQPELKKSKKIRQYFDYWGNRCYAFSSALGKNYLFYKRESKKKKIDFDINIDNFKKMGGEYVFSSVKLINEQLTFLNSFENSDTYYIIYLYKVKQ